MYIHIKGREEESQADVRREERKREKAEKKLQKSELREKKKAEKDSARQQKARQEAEKEKQVFARYAEAISASGQRTGSAWSATETASSPGLRRWRPAIRLIFPAMRISLPR